LLSAFRLTFGIHRFEVVIAVVVAGLAALGLLYLSWQMHDVGIPEGCWPRDFDDEYGLPECRRMLTRFWEIENAGGGWARAMLSFLSPILGVLLGVSIVAREVELRTAELAWSLSRRRSRWLLQRVLPMLAIALVLLVVLGFLGWWYFEALSLAKSWPEMTELASLGIGLVARGLLAMGVALLLGAIAGRTMPALVLAVIAIVAWSLIAVPALHGALAEDRAVWRSDGDWRNGEGSLVYVGSGVFDPERPGKEGEPGRRLTERKADRLSYERCGDYPDDDSPQARRHEECQQRYWESVQWAKVVPQSEFGLIQAVDAMVSLLIGGGAFLLTFPVVARRRPS
jgi:hypothetical protein